MTQLVYTAMALGATVCAMACLVRAVWYARCPIHLRWELYPVPHDQPERVRHMVPEILFLHALRTFNRALWRRSFPFHFGLYLLTASGLGLLTLAIVTRVAGRGWADTTVGSLLHQALGGFGWLGLVLAIGGACALLHRRWSDPALRTYTTAGDVFNLLFFITALSTLGAGSLSRPAGAPDTLAIFVGLLSWDAAVPVTPWLAAGCVLVSALVAYIPLTHMSHFIGKYFTYHAVRWDDATLGGHPEMAAALAEYLTYRPTWSAPHITRPGRPTWAEVVTTNPTHEVDR